MNFKRSIVLSSWTNLSHTHTTIPADRLTELDLTTFSVFNFFLSISIYQANTLV